ncbi:MAG: integration host factor subunit beta [bacterium]|nr:integration host factor subunit beta [bacterium]
MIKADLIEKVSEAAKIPRQDAQKVVETTFQIIKDALAAGDRIELRDFGVFLVKQRVARVGRNPKTKVEAPIPARKMPVFKPGRELKQIVNTK